MTLDVSADELAVIGIFARRVQSARSNVMSIGEILGSADADRRPELHAALRSLAERGWLLTNATGQWDDHHDCVLTGDGLRLAQSPLRPH